MAESGRRIQQQSRQHPFATTRPVWRHWQSRPGCYSTDLGRSQFQSGCYQTQTKPRTASSLVPATLRKHATALPNCLLRPQGLQRIAASREHRHSHKQVLETLKDGPRNQCGTGSREIRRLPSCIDSAARTLSQQLRHLRLPKNIPPAVHSCKSSRSLAHRPVASTHQHSPCCYQRTDRAKCAALVP